MDKPLRILKSTEQFFMLIVFSRSEHTKFELQLFELLHHIFDTYKPSACKIKLDWPNCFISLHLKIYWGSILVRLGVPGIYPSIYKSIHSLYPSPNKLFNVGPMPYNMWDNGDVSMNNTQCLSLQVIHRLVRKQMRNQNLVMLWSKCHTLGDCGS